MKKTWNGILFAMVTIIGSCSTGERNYFSQKSVSQSNCGEVADSFQFPLSSYKVTGFHFNQDVVIDEEYKGQHAGEDAHGVAGTHVYAIASGCIKLSRAVNNYGHALVIEHYLPDGRFVTSLYGHLRAKGLRGLGAVSKGEHIGELGARGEIGGNWGPHLHFQIKKRRFDNNTHGWVSKSNIANFEHPTNFINAHKNCSRGPIPTVAHNAINDRVNSIRDYKDRGDLGVHWYGGTCRKVAIRDIKLPSGCDAAVVFDVEGGARKAYLIKCGFWNYWASKGGPNSVLKMPITEEYSNDIDIFQDFKDAYLSYRIEDGAIDQRNYRRATPGKASKGDGSWIAGKRISYAFAEAYERHHGRVGIGDASQPHGGTADVHKWENIWVQDFDYGKHGWCLLMYNANQDKVHLIRGGFWQVYRDKSLINKLREPTGDEFRINSQTPHQDFIHGYLEFDVGKLKICSHGGKELHKDSTYCNRSRRRICIPHQYICDSKSIQKQCYQDGRGWTKTHCPNGCFQNQCNVCKLGSTRCKDINTQQRCGPNGKRLTEERCIHRCMNGHCVFQVPCIPNQKVCKDTGVLLVCSSDGKYWIKLPCENGCSYGQCRFCWPFTYRCKSISTEQVCSTDGKRYIDQPCAHRCDNGRCIFKLPCKPRQIVCKDASAQLTCSSDGKRWTQTPCPDGCANNQCNFCTPWTYRCKSITTEQVCSPDGKRFIDQICAHRCDNGRCLHQVPCKPNQTVCKDKTQFTCSADGKKWTKKSCEHGCGQWTCLNGPPPKDTTSPPLPKTFCEPHTRRCVNQKETQLCMSDGSKWVPQFTCKNSCTDGYCESKFYTCAITFDSQTRQVSITGTHDVTYFSSSCAVCAITDHTTSKTTPTIPQNHTFIHPRGKGNAWLWQIPRACAYHGSIRWIETKTGGKIEITK